MAKKELTIFGVPKNLDPRVISFDRMLKPFVTLLWFYLTE